MQMKRATNKSRQILYFLEKNIPDFQESLNRGMWTKIKLSIWLIVNSELTEEMVPADQ